MLLVLQITRKRKLPANREVLHDDESDVDGNADDSGSPPEKKTLLDNSVDAEHTPPTENLEIQKIREAHKQKVLKLKKKLKVKQQRAQHLNRRVTSLKSIVISLKLSS